MPFPSARITGASLALAVAAALLAVPTLPAGAAGPRCTVKGTPGNDRLVGTKKDDVICGLGGNDTLMGRGGDDKLLGGDGGDILRGGAGHDLLRGQAGHDTLLGSGGSDRLAGGGSSDRLDGGMGADRLVGNGGKDTAWYLTRRVPLTIALDGTATSGAAGEGDRIATDVETAFGGRHDDLLTGGPLAHGFLGGPGTDTVSYAGRTAAVTIALDDTATSGEADEGDRIRPDVEIAIGGNGDDVLLGGDGDNTLLGGPGADTLDGRGGDDTLVGDGTTVSVAGALRARTGVVAASEGGGDDTLSGGAGNDTVSYADQSLPVTADLDGLAGDGPAGEADTIGTDVENLTGGSGDDTLTGDGGANTLDGGDGADVLSGGDGGDLLDAGAGTGDLTDGGTGEDVCVASDELIEDVPNCEPLAGGSFGVYNLVSLDPPPEADAQPGVGDGSKVPVVADTLSTGEVIVAVASESGDPSVTKLDDTGAIDRSFGVDGWVYGLRAQLGVTQGAPISLDVIDDFIYLGIRGADSYLAKLDSNGVLQTDWADGGFLALSDALGPVSCTIACGNYGFKVSETGISLGYNDFDPNAPQAEQWTVGVLRFAFADGSPVSTTEFDEPLIDGELPSDVLATPDGAALTISRQGDVRRHLADGSPDSAFAGDGVLEPDSGLLGDGQGIPKPQLFLSEAGFTRLGVGGTVAPPDGTGVPKLVATEPQIGVVEQFALDGTALTLPGDSWSATAVDLPAEPEECDIPAAGSQSFATNAMEPVFSSALLPVRRCSDSLWIALDPAGGGTVLQRSGPNLPRDADSVTVAAGTLLGYASARGIVSIELVTGG